MAVLLAEPLTGGGEREGDYTSDVSRQNIGICQRGLGDCCLFDGVDVKAVSQFNPHPGGGVSHLIPVGGGGGKRQKAHT